MNCLLFVSTIDIYSIEKLELSIDNVNNIFKRELDFWKGEDIFIFNAFSMKPRLKQFNYIKNPFQILIFEI